mmetsp:Transcript_21887/g.36995  ORF Transcript_21887/g.36995 Transcript_21887/m.36995 type:complete len:233 (-) Transcript_21887:1630-2328(-)
MRLFSKPPHRPYSGVLVLAELHLRAGVLLQFTYNSLSISLSTLTRENLRSLLCLYSLLNGTNTSLLLYRLAIAFAYFSATNCRLSLKVGVKSSVCTAKSQGRMQNFCTLAALKGHTVSFLFVCSMALATAATKKFSDPCATHALMVVARSLGVAIAAEGKLFWKAKASPSRSSPPGCSPLAPSAFRVTRRQLKGILSPTIMTLEMAGQSALMLSSMGTGAMFSPPAPIKSSL